MYVAVFGSVTRLALGIEKPRGDDHESLGIVHGVDDPTIPDPDAVVVSAGPAS